jgi:hypothetical protein
MPNVYKEKNCQNCGIPHRKRGVYCCQACANKGRPGYSDKVRENMRKVSEEYKQTPEGIANSKLIQSPLTSEDYAVEIPVFYDIPDGYIPNDF